MYILRKIFLPLETFHILLYYRHRIHRALLGFYVNDQSTWKLWKGIIFNFVLAQQIVKLCVVEN